MISRNKGFTIVELLIVIVIIAILAAITVVAYNGIQSRARQSQLQSDIANVNKQILAYHAINGSYPFTAANLNPDWGTVTGRTDANCPIGTQDADWVPNIENALPQSPDSKGVGGFRGCYIYASDGTNYVLSAWNMNTEPQKTTMYRRLGFREMDGLIDHNNVFFVCNNSALGGGTYNQANDYYKHSLTISNITTCNETPPSGA